MVLNTVGQQASLSLYDLSFKESFESTASDGPFVSSSATGFDPFERGGAEKQDLYVGISADDGVSNSFVGSIR